MKKYQKNRKFSHKKKNLPYTMLMTFTNLALLILQAQYFIHSFFQDACTEIQIWPKASQIFIYKHNGLSKCAVQLTDPYINQLSHM